MQLISKHLLLIASILTVSVCAFVVFSIAPNSALGATTVKKTTTTKAKVVTPAKKTTTKKTTPAKAKAAFEYSGWIPYWRTATGTADVYPHLGTFAQIHPFGYTVKKDGSLYDASNLEDGTTWTSFIAQAHAKKTLIVPSVMWSSGATIDSILGDPIARMKHEDAIVDMVTRNNFDGVDIDYEGKIVSTRDAYSLFLKELKGKLGTKMLSCTIEARTPPSSLYKNIPADLEYVNDYKEINKYCDRVKLMTYDQQSADIVLNKAGDRLYSPVSDPLWVQKVVALTLQDIDKSKLVIGVPTYGYIYKVTPWDDGTGYHYDLEEAFNPRYATELATQLDIKPVRNRAGELSFTYVPDELSASSTPVTSSTGTTTIQMTQDQLASYAPKNTPSGLRAALGAKKLAETTGAQQSFYMLWWSDSKAIADKIALAKKLGVRGVAVFKLDGGEDPGIWAVLK